MTALPSASIKACFNSQPLEGGCVVAFFFRPQRHVSTHSRSKAAAWLIASLNETASVSTHSRSKAAACSIAVTAYT